MIFYFSGTGNTRWVATRLAAATGEQLIPITQAVADQQYEYQIAPSERIGICFPIHGWRPPFIVRDFVRQLTLQGYQDQFCYAFATCGDDVGLTFDYLASDLQCAGIRLDSAFSVIMPETYNFPFIDQIDTPDSARRKVAAATERLQRLLPMVVGRQRSLMHINKSRWPRINSRLLGSFFLKHWVDDAKFTIDADRCKRCGLCASVCPVGNIDCAVGCTPRWLHNGLCTTCFSCYHHCPAHAIDFAGRTRGKRQYFFDSSLVPTDQNEKTGD